MIHTHVREVAAGGTASPLDALLTGHPRREEAWVKIDR